MDASEKEDAKTAIKSLKEEFFEFEERNLLRLALQENDDDANDLIQQQFVSFHSTHQPQTNDDSPTLQGSNLFQNKRRVSL
jgi:hypothetical protein